MYFMDPQNGEVVETGNEPTERRVRALRPVASGSAYIPRASAVL